MDNLDIAVIGGSDRVLDGGRGETLLEETVHVASQNGLKLFLFLKPGNEVLGGLVCPLLDLAIAPFLPGRVGFSGIVCLRYLKWNACEVRAVAVCRLQL